MTLYYVGDCPTSKIDRYRLTGTHDFSIQLDKSAGILWKMIFLNLKPTAGIQ
jgi:hypothetical protein